MAKIFFDLQLSSYDVNGKLLLQSDSNWIFTRALIDGLTEIGHTCVVLIPKRVETAFLWPKPDNLLYEALDYGGTEQDRYFLSPRIIDIVKSQKPDIIWTNDPCRVGNYRSFWDGPLIAYNHWIDTPSDPKMPQKKTYFFRQFEAAFKADYMLFNSNFGVKQFENHITVPDTLWKRAKMRAVNPPLRTDLIKEVIDMDLHPTMPTLIFNHRLSSAPQYQRNVDNFFEVVDSLQGKQFGVLYSNPSGKNDIRFLKNEWLNIHNQDYKIYLMRLSMGTVQLTLFDYPGQWSIAMAECLTLGMNVIYPNKYGYKEMAEGHGTSYSKLEAVKKSPSIILNTSLKRTQQQEYFLERFSPKFIVKNQVEPIIKDLLHEHI